MYEPAFNVITRVDGSSIAARRVKDGRVVHRDASQYKLVNSLIRESQGQTKEENSIPDSERENLMKNIEEGVNPECIQDNESNILIKETEVTTTGTGTEKTETHQDVQLQAEKQQTKKEQKKTSIFSRLRNLKTIRCRDNH